MRRVWILLLAATVWAQARGNRPVAERVRLRGTAGAGHIQKEFLGALSSEFWDEFGKSRAEEIFDRLQRRGMTANDVQRLMNGLLTKSELRKRFGAKRNEVERMERIIDGAVTDKDRKLFFGILIATMIEKHEEDPSGEFCKQVAATCSAIDEKQARELLKGAVSKNMIKEIFKFRHKADLKLMQRILNSTWDSAYVGYPMAQSLARRGGRRKGGRSRYDASAFPKLERGMPGFGGEFARGTAGGFPFDSALPACPYFGEDLEELFKNLK